MTFTAFSLRQFKNQDILIMTQMILKESHPTETHACQSRRDGDWIVFTCPHCDYELWDNWRSDELKIFNAKQHINHRGSHLTEDYVDNDDDHRHNGLLN